MIQSGLRCAVAASAAQAGDGDWIKTSIPSGRRLKPPDGYGTYDEACIERTETFLFGGISRQSKNAFSASSAPAVKILFWTSMWECTLKKREIDLVGSSKGPYQIRGHFYVAVERRF